MNEGLETARLSLRPIAVDDAELLVALDSDPEVMRFISGGEPTSPDEAARIVERAIAHRWIAYERSAGEFVGWFGVRPSAGRDRELGYRLRRDAWGKGFATEGSRALIDVAFTSLDADRVWAQTMTVNTASRGVMERCGLRFVRTFFLEWPDRIEGTEEGEVEYELTKAEWANARS